MKQTRKLSSKHALLKRSTEDSRVKALKYTAPALEKGLDILELFAQQTQGLTKSEVARRLNRTASEVFRMLICLQSRGYIRQGADETYSLTLRLFELAQQHPPTKRLINEAMKVMHTIAYQVHQSCHLAVIEDGVVVILAQAPSPSSFGFAVKPGSQVDVMLAASGYVILAYQNEQALGHILEQARQRGSLIAGDLVPHLDRIRKRGYEERKSYQVHGVTNISFPILDAHGEAIAALSVPFLPRLDEDVKDAEVIAVLRKGAMGLSVLMGWCEKENGRPC